MILLFGGTTEGREAARMLDGEGLSYLYSTRGETDFRPHPPSTARHGSLTGDALAALARERGIRLLVDAAHPFASGLHETVAAAAVAFGMPALRLQRPTLPRPEDASVRYLPDFQAVLPALRELGVRRLLAFTGVQSLPRLKPYWEASPEARLWIRVLPRAESLEKALALGLPRESLLPCMPARTAAEHIELIRRCGAEAILTKDGGIPGALPQKLEAARACAVPALVISRPSLPVGFRVVESVEALRLAVRESLA